MSANAGRPSPPTLIRVAVIRCCAKCKTPYNCGNVRCACHGEVES